MNLETICFPLNLNINLFVLDSSLDNFLFIFTFRFPSSYINPDTSITIALYKVSVWGEQDYISDNFGLTTCKSEHVFRRQTA